MEAPQYKGEEALEVHVYAGRISGDLDEIQVLNQYVGVHLPLDTPELHAAPWVIGFLLLLAVAWVLTPAKWARAAAAVLFIAIILTSITATVALNRRLYQLGHERDRGVFARVEDFTPPLFGNAKIENFMVHTAPETGAWTFAGAGLLAGWATFRRRKQSK